MSVNINIESASVERLELEIVTDADPTGGAVEFQVTDNATTSPSGSWSAGTWRGSATQISTYRWRTLALTPTIGGAGATLSLTEGTLHRLWSRVGGTVVDLAALVKAT